MTLTVDAAIQALQDKFNESGHHAVVITFSKGISSPSVKIVSNEGQWPGVTYYNRDKSPYFYDDTLMGNVCVTYETIKDKVFICRRDNAYLNAKDVYTVEENIPDAACVLVKNVRTDLTLRVPLHAFRALLRNESIEALR